MCDVGYVTAYCAAVSLRSFSSQQFFFCENVLYIAERSSICNRIPVKFVVLNLWQEIQDARPSQGKTRRIYNICNKRYQHRWVYYHNFNFHPTPWIMRNWKLFNQIKTFEHYFNLYGIQNFLWTDALVVIKRQRCPRMNSPLLLPPEWTRLYHVRVGVTTKFIRIFSSRYFCLILI